MARSGKQVVFGGAKRAYKPKGRASAAKAYRAMLRERTKAGSGHAADGRQRAPESGSANWKHLFAGYNFR